MNAVAGAIVTRCIRALDALPQSKHVIRIT